MKSSVFFLFLAFLPVALTLAQEPVCLPAKPGTWRYAYLKDENTKVYCKQFGMTPEEIPRIFEEFYRTEAAKSMKETGTGLGLPIANRIVANHGGKIKVASQPGKGAEFTVLLPRQG